MEAARIGLCGDILTFAGAVMLAIEALEREKEFNTIRRSVETLGDKAIGQFRWSMRGLEVDAGPNSGNVKRVFLHRSARMAKYGCVVLAIGFLFLVAARVMELGKAGLGGA